MSAASASHFLLAVVIFTLGAPLYDAPTNVRIFEDGSHLEFDVSRAETDGVHELYVVQANGERALLWQFIYYASSGATPTQPHPQSLNIGVPLLGAWKDGKKCTVLFQDIWSAVYFLKVDTAVSPHAWQFGHFPHQFSSFGIHQVKWRRTGPDSFAGQLRNEPPTEFKIAANGEIFMDGKATGKGAWYINGEIIAGDAYRREHKGGGRVGSWVWLGIGLLAIAVCLFLRLTRRK